MQKNSLSLYYKSVNQLNLETHCIPRTPDPAKCFKMSCWSTLKYTFSIYSQPVRLKVPASPTDSWPCKLKWWSSEVYTFEPYFQTSYIGRPIEPKVLMTMQSAFNCDVNLGKKYTWGTYSKASFSKRPIEQTGLLEIQSRLKNDADPDKNILWRSVKPDESGEPLYPKDSWPCKVPQIDMLI